MDNLTWNGKTLEADDTHEIANGTLTMTSAKSTPPPPVAVESAIVTPMGEVFAAEATTVANAYSLNQTQLLTTKYVLC